MCGKYNLNQADDFLLPSGVTTVSVSDFGNAWRTNVNCDLKGELASGVSIDACTQSSTYLFFAKTICSGLSKGEISISLLPISLKSPTS